MRYFHLVTKQHCTRHTRTFDILFSRTECHQ